MGKAENPVSEVIGQFSKIMERLLPVGSIIEWAPVEGGANVDLTTPQSVSNYYGFGTWEAYGSGQMLLGVSESHEVGSVGGEEKHALTGPEGARHVHTWLGWALRQDGWGTGKYTALGGFKGDAWDAVTGGAISYEGGAGLNYAGEGKPHENMPPFITVYRWRRIA